MKHILILILSFVALTTVAQDETTQTLFTSAKELEKIPDYEINFKQVYNIALTNIKDCKTDSERISTIKWYLSFMPLQYKFKLKLYVDKNYPHLKWAIRH